MSSETPSRIRIATRESRLALWQAEHVAARLREAAPDVEVELLPMTTTGDQRLDVSLAKVGGKGLFLKELERAMQEGLADIAVHSMKDVPAELPAGLCIAAILERADPHDAFVSNDFADLTDLPQGARLGTSSLRRQCQVKALRPDLEIVPLRGNVETRLRKLDAGECHAALLATAGLVRLGLADRVRHSLDPQVCLPAIGQGAIGIECRSDDAASIALVQQLAHPETDARVRAERALNEGLDGSCHAPIAGFAELSPAGLALRGLVGHPDGSPLLRAERTGPADQPRELGLALAEELLAQGAGRILAALDDETT